MPRQTNNALIAAMIAVAVVFCGVVAYLVSVRFGAGEGFPVYSTWRSDPLGAKALYTAFERQPNLDVQRFHRPPAEIAQIVPAGNGAGTTLFFLGATDSPDPRQAIETLNQFLSLGGRVVVAFHGSTREEPPQPDEPEADPEAPASKEEIGPAAPWAFDMVDIADVWGFKIAYAERPESKIDRGFIGFDVQNEDHPALPKTLPWHSSMYFADLADEWETVYGWRHKDGDLHSVVIGRRWGAGSLVLCSDTYLFSNEAMQADRRPAFLAWLGGASRLLVFDEAHLGAVQRPNVMGLVRKYRLHGVLFTLVAVALLFVWKNATSLAPRRPSVAPEMRARATQGTPLADLLRRHIPPARLLGACVEEWSKDSTPEQRRRVEQHLETGAPIVQTYATISKVLAERKPYREHTE